MSEPKFSDWMEAVDNILEKEFGAGSDALPDQTYWDWFESDISPEDAAQMAWENSQ